MRFLKSLAIVAAVFFLAGAALWVLSPRETWPSAAQVGPVDIGTDLDAWLAQRESVFDDITEGAEKHIFWANDAHERTEFAVVYLHGFSATRAEISPVAERIAESLGANLFATRFAGHGRSGDALAEASAADWAYDLAEAMAIARRLGNRIILIGTSTGGSIATLAALDPDYAPDIWALITISPNFEINSDQAWLLDLPFARDWVPRVSGETREWTPHNAEQARFWTTRYPSVAVFPMRTVQSAAAAADFATATVPMLVFYASGDQVVLPAATARVIQQWGSRVDSYVVDGADNPSQHVLAGDILSPSTTDWVVDRSLTWLADQ
ncbi:alpha/beta hydrolase [Pararhodobacter sp.]|uniref:alpha/beta hydrolase n=1 Tax=Pararhodobacter sp. TaxID=2127056 RepID=UPI002AFDF8FD|nr:alpha/beta fold hydrolase [Pararhodobacter sp.]